MIEGARAWLLAMLAACILCSVADSLMPTGPVKGVGKLVCGLVLLCALLSGAKGLDVAAGQAWLDDWLAGVGEERAYLENQVNGEMKTIIEERFAEYIVDKAAELGLSCTAQVTCQLEGEVYLPSRVQLDGVLEEGQRERLTQIIWEELGVPPEEQVYRSGEGSR